MTYYECHITVDPVFGAELDLFKTLCADEDFRVADLFLQKRKTDTPERSALDSFCTGRDCVYSAMYQRMVALLHALRAAGFKIRRYKIEECSLDSRFDQSAFPLDRPCAS